MKKLFLLSALLLTGCSKKTKNYVKDGKSLNKVIECILGNSSNKKDNGITGYLTTGYYRRDIFESSAVISAMETLLNFKSNYKKLDKKIDKTHNVEKIWNN